jgi:serine/threonine-protein kinase
MLTDFYPFYSRLPVAIMQMHITDEPPLPTDKRADLPPQINDVMRRVLAKRPIDRYQSAGAFAEALSEALGVKSAKKRLNVSPSMVFFLGAIAILAITIALMLLMNQPPV